MHKANQFGQTVGAGSLVDVMPWLQYFPNPVRSVFKNFEHLNNEFFKFVQDKVKQHRETFDPEITRDMSDAIIGVIDKADSNNGLTTEHTEATVSDLIGAGLDTVSTALHWLLLLLAKYPEMQTKLHKLIDQVVGRNRLPSVEDRGQLAYLDAFIYETMRFTSFIPITIPHSTTSSSKAATFPKTQWSSSTSGPSITTLRRGRSLMSLTHRAFWIRTAPSTKISPTTS